ncbi:MAG: M15 family metallopeptidase [Actinomycetota bacterium]|nr:M15 family metallopeptidase [Actinomycetota bacterium]
MRRAVLFLCVCLLAGACGGRQNTEPLALDDPAGATRSLELPPPVPAIAAYRIDLARTLPERVRSRIEEIKEVAVVAGVARESFKVSGPTGLERITVASTKPLRFRTVAPAATKEAEFVWSALIAGRGVLTFDAARKLGIEGAGQLEISGSPPLPIGAFAANGAPDLGDVLVADHVGRELGLGDADVLIVGAEPGSDLERLGSRLRDELRGHHATVEPILDTSPAPVDPAGQPQPVGHAEGGAVGSMSFRILKGGFIEPDPAWVAANIATGQVAILGTVTCHRLVFPQLHAAMTEIANEGLAAEVDPDDYGGCYVPRFIDRDPKKPLSMHAFGLAFDINVSGNYLGTKGDQDPRVVEILAKWGFEWGGLWDRPDPMHFELVRLVQT